MVVATCTATATNVQVAATCTDTITNTGDDAMSASADTVAMMNLWQAEMLAGNFANAALVYTETGVLTVAGTAYTGRAGITGFFAVFAPTATNVGYTITSVGTDTFSGVYDFGTAGQFDYVINLAPGTADIVSEVVTLVTECNDNTDRATCEGLGGGGKCLFVASSYSTACNDNANLTTCEGLGGGGKCVYVAGSPKISAATGATVMVATAMIVVAMTAIANA